MGTISSQITSLTIVHSTVYSDANQRKYQSSASLAFVREIHRGPVISPHKWPVTRKMFPFDDVIMPWPFILHDNPRGSFHGRFLLPLAMVIGSQQSLHIQRQHSSLKILYVLNFSGGTKHIFTFYVIPPYWHDTGGWNPSSSKTGT